MFLTSLSDALCDYKDLTFGCVKTMGSRSPIFSTLLKACFTITSRPEPPGSTVRGLIVSAFPNSIAGGRRPRLANVPTPTTCFFRYGKWLTRCVARLLEQSLQQLVEWRMPSLLLAVETAQGVLRRTAQGAGLIMRHVDDAHLL